jgi:hypothetical protein
VLVPVEIELSLVHELPPVAVFDGSAVYIRPSLS